MKQDLQVSVVILVLLFLGRGTVLQSCVIFAICILGIYYSYFQEVVR